ncbi:MAG: pyruvate kinase [Candidatus Brennerbacteria bacterium]|nr:pyruvate kinase [Candidatus Brennerbacteria bacterium]
MKSTHTKIIASVGPRSESEEAIEALIHHGTDIVRSNFSHCTHGEYRKRKALIEKAARRLKKNVPIMQDLQGPRIRVGNLPEKGIELEEGKTYVFAFHNGAKIKFPEVIPIDDPYLHADIKKGDPFYLANAAMELLVTKVSGKRIAAKVLRGGILLPHKGINVPQTKLKRGGLTPKDVRDVKFALREGVDYVALSFVQSAEDVEKLRRIVGKRSVKIIAKIERAFALQSIDEIIRAADGIMVARGDLGIELPFEEVPLIQKDLVRHAHWHGKPAIIATQMLSSMINHPTPTRAEVSDIANAVFDGADAVMLSDETAAGEHPVKSVLTMRKIVRRAEEYFYHGNFFEDVFH